MASQRDISRPPSVHGDELRGGAGAAAVSKLDSKICTTITISATVVIIAIIIIIIAFTTCK